MPPDSFIEGKMTDETKREGLTPDQFKAELERLAELAKTDPILQALGRGAFKIAEGNTSKHEEFRRMAVNLMRTICELDGIDSCDHAHEKEVGRITQALIDTDRKARDEERERCAKELEGNCDVKKGKGWRCWHDAAATIIRNLT